MLGRVVVTGGAGFVGSSLALAFKRDGQATTVIALDNLKRRGSELALDRLRAGGVEFVHGDVRSRHDLDGLGPANLVVEASAEPSVHAGYDGNPNYLTQTNLLGAINCLEYARRHRSDFVFLSTSRVYPIEPLRALPLSRTESRFVLDPDVCSVGVSSAGISETFPLSGHRSLYGATKLAAELIVQEYCAMYGLRAIVNRCGVIAGPWQMGKVDQGFVVLWLARHLFGGPLSYIGFGGEGLQVRDVLHIDDLYDLVIRQLASINQHTGLVYNVGGGSDRSVSLRELTHMSQRLSKKNLGLGRISETSAADIPLYISDCRAVTQATGWNPTRSMQKVLEDIWQWLVDHRVLLEPILGR